MRLDVVSFDKDKKKLDVALSGLEGDKIYAYKFDTDTVDFRYIWKYIRDDLKAKGIIKDHLKELRKKSKFDKTEKPDPNMVDLEALYPGKDQPPKEVIDAILAGGN